jgi:putative transposase
MSGKKVAAALEVCTADIPPPVSITIDHGSEFTSKALEEWAWRCGVKLVRYFIYNTTTRV